MKRTRLVILGALAVGAVALPACNKSSESADKKAETKATEPAQDKKSARAKPPVDALIDVPTEEDFEESAANQIKDDADLQKELDQLEKEIGK